MDLQKLKQKTRLGNSGFSLVELIIVIAIMAVLIAVLAPMFIRYVERSRISRDAQAAGQFLQAMKTIASDPTINPTGSLQLGWDGATGAISRTGEMSSAAATSAFNATIPGADTGSVAAVSSTFRDSGIISITLNPATGQVSTSNSVSGGNDNANYFISLIADLR